MLSIDEVAARFTDARRSGRGYKAICPLHDDQSPSLGIDPADHGGVLLCCPVCNIGAKEIIASGKVNLTWADIQPGHNGHTVTWGDWERQKDWRVCRVVRLHRRSR